MTGPESRSELPGEDPSKGTFTPKVLDKTVIAIPLLERLRTEQALEQERGTAYEPPLLGVVLDLNLQYFGGRGTGRERAVEGEGTVGPRP